jgi:hypothetical protein
VLNVFVLSDDRSTDGPTTNHQSPCIFLSPLIHSFIHSFILTLPLSPPFSFFFSRYLPSRPSPRLVFTQLVKQEESATSSSSSPPSGWGGKPTFANVSLLQVFFFLHFHCFASFFLSFFLSAYLPLHAVLLMLILGLDMMIMMKFSLSCLSLLVSPVPQSLMMTFDTVTGDFVPLCRTILLQLIHLMRRDGTGR